MTVELVLVFEVSDKGVRAILGNDSGKERPICPDRLHSAQLSVSPKIVIIMGLLVPQLFVHDLFEHLLLLDEERSILFTSEDLAHFDEDVTA